MFFFLVMDIMSVIILKLAPIYLPFTYPAWFRFIIVGNTFSMRKANFVVIVQQGDWSPIFEVFSIFVFLWYQRYNTAFLWDWHFTIFKGTVQAINHNWTNGIPEETVKFNSKAIRARCFIIHKLLPATWYIPRVLTALRRCPLLPVWEYSGHQKKVEIWQILDRHFWIDKFFWKNVPPLIFV